MSRRNLPRRRQAVVRDKLTRDDILDAIKELEDEIARYGLAADITEVLINIARWQANVQLYRRGMWIEELPRFVSGRGSGQGRSVA